MVIKKSGRRVAFDRERIEQGIEHALVKRPVSTVTRENLVNEIEEEVRLMGKTSREVATSAIGDLILDKLHALDKVAYIRFASVYRHFETIDDFFTEIKKLEDA
jgi:transcriptional repressor NrdR